MSDKTVCPNCKNEVDFRFAFCPFCGKSMKPGQKTKEFEFGFMSYNAMVAKEVNLWLKEQKNIVIKSIHVNTWMNHNIPLKWETVPTRIVFEYENVNAVVEYQYLCFTSKSVFGHSYKKVTGELEEWKKVNANAKVLWKSEFGHQSNQGNTQLLLALAQMN